LFKVDRLKGKTTIPAKVTVPEPEEIDEQEIIPFTPPEDVTRSVTQHTEI